MPTYDYSCENCGHAFEKTLKIVDRRSPEGDNCPACGAENSVRMQILGAPKIVAEHNDFIRKVPDWYKDRVGGIKKKYPRNTIDI